MANIPDIIDEHLQILESKHTHKDMEKQMWFINSNYLDMRGDMRRMMESIMQIAKEQGYRAGYANAMENFTRYEQD